MSEQEIAYLHGRRVWDGHGRPAVEAEIMLAGGAVGRAIAPPWRAASVAGDVGAEQVATAVAAINGAMSDALMGRDGSDQASLDAALLDLAPEPDWQGANATLAVSLAAAHAAAAANGMPLYRHLSPELTDLVLPAPMIRILGPGDVGGGLVREVLLTCPGAATVAQALEWAAEIHHAAEAELDRTGARWGVDATGGFWTAASDDEALLATMAAVVERAKFDPHDEVAFAIGTTGAPALLEHVEGWLDRFPVVSILGAASDMVSGPDEAELATLSALTRLVGGRAQVVGDAAFGSDAALVATGVAREAGNAIVLTPGARRTVTQTRAAWDAARAAGWGGIIAAGVNSTEDTTVVHLAIGWGVGQLKAGGFARSERMAKWNEAVRIEEVLGPVGRYVGAPVIGRTRQPA